MTYVLERNTDEYERLRMQARLWEPATERLLDRIALDPGATCLDVGCGPGESMLLLADRGAHVLGVDVDADAGAHAIARLDAAGHDRCAFEVADAERELPDGPFDLVFARLFLLHVDDPAAMLKRLWDRVALDGHLVVMDHDMGSPGVVPPLESTHEFNRVVLGAFAATGSDLELGRRLPWLHEQAGIGSPDGTEITGRLEPLREDAEVYAAIFRSMLPAAISLGLTTQERGERWFEQLERDVERHGERALMWPLMVGTWKGK